MSRKIMSTGVGPSKQFGVGRDEELPAQHVGGRPVGGGQLDHLLGSTYTDEGVAEKAARPKARSSVVRDEFEKRIDARRDFKLTEAEPWMAPDPMGEMAAAHCPPGHKPRFLSSAKVQREGLRGWKPVIGENGDPVRLGNMTLASMPIEKAEARNAFYRGKDAEKISTIYQNQVEQISQSGLRPIMAQRGENSLTRTHGNTALDD
jgi:hypothetical protein